MSQLLFRETRGPHSSILALAASFRRPAKIVGFGLLAAVAGLLPARSTPRPASSSEILQELRSFRELGSVLYVAAHPDDENTRLIAYLARGRGLRTGYLSVTRGDGGQNLIGTELRDLLGVIRTQELLAARRIDGGRQFFTRANDFGFSKDVRETLSVWDRDQVLADIVRVIRTFRPDVIVTRFSIVPSGTHGHHTASAQLAKEAFTLAADPTAFREELGDLEPWQVKRLLWNTGGGPQRTGGDAPPSNVLRLDIGGYNALLGESYGEIAARSRTMHKSQGFGSIGSRGTSYDQFQHLAGDPATNDILDGVETTWARVPGGAGLDALVGQIIAHFNPVDPSASIPALLDLRKRVAELPASGLVTDKRRQLDQILQACLGLYWESVIPQAEAVPGETLAFRHSAIVRANVPVRWVAVRYPSLKQELAVGVDLAVNQPVNRESQQTLPSSTALSQPYWLRRQGSTGMFAVDDSNLIGQPENPPALAIEHVFEIGGQTLVVADDPVQVIDDPVKGEIRRRLEVIPPVSLTFAQELELLTPGATREITVDVTAARAHAKGTIQIEALAGWNVAPASHAFALTRAGEKARFTFTVTAPTQPTTAALIAVADVGGAQFRNRRLEIRYDHIPPQLLQPPAALKAVSLDLQIRGKNVGYLPGAGDLVGESLARMGYAVTTLGAGDLTPERLKAFDAVVLGVRAFNTRSDLPPQLSGLFAYAEQGGTVIVQYNTTADLPSVPLAPYALRVSRDRVTDERAPISLLAPDHPALNTPNKITPADFEGWVQERGLYFPNQWGPEFTPLLASSDAGEKPLAGALLVAKHGRGYYVYTGLSFFRELPEGVPGAYRLFANLVSLGK